MRVTLKEFQEDAVADLHSAFETMQHLVAKESAALLLSAPTGSGKTLMATALVEDLLFGTEGQGDDGDPGLTFLWLSDDPELNLQSCSKLGDTSSELNEGNLVIVDGTLDAEQLDPGKVYFLNTDKLGSGTTFVKTGDGRTFSLWETLANTVAADPSRFVLIIDEAHRGAKGAAVARAETIMQKFVVGSSEIPAVPLVIGVSATPDRFVELCSKTDRVLRRVTVDPARVRESGLLKEWVDLYHPDEAQPSDATMLQQAITVWSDYCTRWGSYTYGGDEGVVRPVLLIQVADAKAGAKAMSTTDLDLVVGTLVKSVDHEAGDSSWIAHTFQDHGDFVAAGHSIRHLSPSKIDADPDVRVVLFKTSLNTGWDCPRAETMVSFRTARDETNIAQLVGRMVRSPLARRVDSDEHLNTVSLWLPFFDRAAVEKIISRLASDPNHVPPTEGRIGEDAVILSRTKGSDACFAVLEALPSYVIPRARPMKPIPRLAKLAALLAETKLEADPVKTYRARLVAMLRAERGRLEGDADFQQRVAEDSVLDIRLRRYEYGVEQKSGEDGEDGDETTQVQVDIAAKNVDDLFAAAGRLLGEGLHREFLRECWVPDEQSARSVKIELHALVSSPGVLEAVNASADFLRKEWTNAHKAAVASMDEKDAQTWRDIEGAGSQPEELVLKMPQSIEGSKTGKAWTKHVYSGPGGKYALDLKSSWERKVVEAELARNDIVGWLRNEDRKPWALCVPRQHAGKWVGIYPDFLFLRTTPSGVIADVVDPHLLGDENAPARAAALATYAQTHGAHFGRFELVIFEKASDETSKRLDLMDESVRNAVANVTTHNHLRQLFETAPSY